MVPIPAPEALHERCMGPHAVVEDLEVVNAAGVGNPVEDPVMGWEERLVRLPMGVRGRRDGEAERERRGDREQIAGSGAPGHALTVSRPGSKLAGPCGTTAEKSLWKEGVGATAA